MNTEKQKSVKITSGNIAFASVEIYQDFWYPEREAFVSVFHPKQNELKIQGVSKKVDQNASQSDF